MALERAGFPRSARRLQRATVRIKRIAYGSLAKFGCLLGGIAMLLPSLTCGVGGLWVVRVLRLWLESWQTFTISALGRDLGSVDLISTLRLTAALERLQALDASGPMAILSVTFALSLAGGLLLALVISLVGLAYNFLAWLTGGLVLELDERD
jgi:hypothetical protein